MVKAHTAAETRVVGIKNVVINLESATIKWCQITKLLREKTEMGQKPKAYVFLVCKSNVGFTSIMDCGNAVSQEINTQNVHC
jgi:hypothetical protein